LGGGFIADAMKFSRVDDAKDLVNQAFQNLNSAYALVPHAPRIHMAQVQDNHFVWDMMFDNIFSDLSARGRIQQSLRSVEQAIMDTRNVIAWIDQQV
jgi:hypothetical protein